MPFFHLTEVMFIFEEIWMHSFIHLLIPSNSKWILATSRVWHQDPGISPSTTSARAQQGTTRALLTVGLQTQEQGVTTPELALKETTSCPTTTVRRPQVTEILLLLGGQPDGRVAGDPSRSSNGGTAGCNWGNTRCPLVKATVSFSKAWPSDVKAHREVHATMKTSPRHWKTSWRYWGFPSPWLGGGDGRGNVVGDGAEASCRLGVS